MKVKQLFSLVWVLPILLFFFFSTTLFANTTNAFSPTIDQLANDPYWKRLLHMPGSTSEIDDPNFFLSPNGKHDAKAELLATLHALQHDIRQDDNATICKFPARAHWLEQQLAITFRQAPCNAYNQLMGQVNAKRVTFVFPAAHISAPSSMFGHTFLLIQSDYESKLLAFAINYAAFTDDDGGVAYAVKGLFGGYKGFYSLQHYYDKLKEYSNRESRDVFEYELNLTQDEIDQMMRHIWELNAVYTYYYFFDENCAYNMLWLLEVARPSISLRKYFYYGVIPAETLKAVDNEGLIRSNKYRPSKRAKLLAYEKRLGAKQAQISVALATGTLSVEHFEVSEDSTDEQKRYILEAAIEYLEYLRLKNEISKSLYLQRSFTLASLRANLGSIVKLLVKRVDDPRFANNANRVLLQSGVRNAKAIALAGFRWTYHSLDDSSIGFLRGTAIEGADIRIRYDEEELALERLTLLSLQSLQQHSTFYHPIAWDFSIGLDNDYDTQAMSTLSLGLGKAFNVEFGAVHGYWFGLIKPLLYVDGAIEHFADAAISVDVGTSLEYEHWQCLIRLQPRYFVQEKESMLARANLLYRFNRMFSTTFEYSYVEQREQVQNSALFSLAYFF